MCTGFHYVRQLMFSAMLACLLAFGCGGADAQAPGGGAGQSPAADESTSDSNTEITAVPNRPTFSTTAESVEPGVFEVEYGLEAAEGHQNVNGLLKLGATKNLELRFANNPIERDRGIAGRGDSGAGFKYKVFPQQSWKPTFSVLYNFTIPTATANVGAGASGHSLGLLLSKDFGQHHVDFNESAQWLGRSNSSGFDRHYFTALAYSRPLRGKWGFTGELAGFSRANATIAATMTVMGAATYNLSSRCVLDAGVYIAAYGQLPRATFFSGVTYSVADLYHRPRGHGKRGH